MNMIKGMHVKDFSIWCDAPPKTETPTKVDDNPVTPVSDAETPVADESMTDSATATIAAATDAGSSVTKAAGSPELESSTHSYILPPTTTEFHFACNSSIDAQLDLMLKSIYPTTLLRLRPAHLHAILALVASLLKHATAAQARLEEVAVRHFRTASIDERTTYMRLYRRILSHRDLSSADQSELDRIQREVTFADLLVMRATAFAQVRAEEKRRQYEQEEREMTGDVAIELGQDESDAMREGAGALQSPPAEKKPGFFNVLWKYAGLVDDEEDRDSEREVGPGEEETDRESTTHSLMQRFGGATDAHTEIEHGRESMEKPAAATTAAPISHARGEMQPT